MLEKFQIDNDDIMPVCVMATMSSGKSTFLNAVLGEELLPEKNEACTARALAVINVPGTAGTRAYIQKSDGNKYVVDIFSPDTVAKINADEDVTEVMIVKDIKSLQNVGKSIVLFDTPGVNHSGDVRHAKRTQKILEGLRKGVIVYLLNATQLATRDDELLLQMVCDHIKKERGVRILFVLNKVDLLDEDKESISNMLANARTYIEDHGLKEFELFPLSALSAKTLRMKLNSQKMTKAEIRHLEQAFQEYKEEGKSMLENVSSYHSNHLSYEIMGETVSEYSLRRAVENTGLVEIERSIERNLCSIINVPPKGIGKLKEYKELEGVYSRKRKSRNYENFTGKAIWICKKCRQINGENQKCLHCQADNVKWRRLVCIL